MSTLTEAEGAEASTSVFQPVDLDAVLDEFESSQDMKIQPNILENLKQVPEEEPELQPDVLSDIQDTSEQMSKSSSSEFESIYDKYKDTSEPEQENPNPNLGARPKEFANSSETVPDLVMDTEDNHVPSEDIPRESPPPYSEIDPLKPKERPNSLEIPEEPQLQQEEEQGEKFLRFCLTFLDIFMTCFWSVF